jgi:hypothetical protein
LRFTVHRPASAEVSPCCHRPSGGDVACGVHVSIARARTAGDALKNRLALAVFRRDMPAVGAPLRRVRCQDKLQPSRSFVRQPGNQQSPPVAVNLTVEAPFLRDAGARAFPSAPRGSSHAAHIQILDADRREPARQIGGGLLHPVTATICFTGAQPGNGQLRSCPPVRSASRPGQTPLQSAQPLGFTSTKARNAQQLPGGQRNRHRHAAINTDDAPISRSRDRFRDDGKSDVPTPGPIQVDSVGLHRVGYVAGPAEPHPTDLGHPYLPIPAAKPLEVARFDTDLPKSFMRASFTPRRASMGAVEKVPHRLREVPQRLLLHGLRPGCQPLVFGAGGGQLSTLLVVTRRSAAWLPVLLLLHGQIPHKPGVATVFDQCCRLLKAGKQPKPAHSSNVTATTDNLPKGGRRRFLPRLKPGVFTPQI